MHAIDRRSLQWRYQQSVSTNVLESERQMKFTITCFGALSVLLFCSHAHAGPSTYEEAIAMAEAQANAGAQAHLHCTGVPLDEARSIRDLPEVVKSLLERSRTGSGVAEIVDQGGEFNKIDFGGGPFRRFSIAGVSQNCVAVAIEQGGRGYHIQVFVFERYLEKWQGGLVRSISVVPQSLDQLREVVYPAK